MRRESSTQSLRYNAMSEQQPGFARGSRPVHQKPSCLSCTRLKHHFDQEEADSVERLEMGLNDLAKARVKVSVEPTCSFLGRAPSSKRMWGIKACEGYDPRPSWDFALPNKVGKESSGAMIMAPSNSKPTRKAEPRHVVVIVPPRQDAIIVPPVIKPASVNPVADTSGCAIVVDPLKAPVGNQVDARSVEGRVVSAQEA